MKNKMKKLLSVLLCAAMTATAAPYAMADDEVTVELSVGESEPEVTVEVESIDGSADAESGTNEDIGTPAPAEDTNDEAADSETEPDADDAVVSVDEIYESADDYADQYKDYFDEVIDVIRTVKETIENFKGFKDFVTEVRGYIPDSFDLSVKEVELDEIELDDYDIPDEDDIIAAFDISLVNEARSEWQPEDEPVEVTLDAAAMGLEDGDIVNIHHEHEGEVTVYENYVVIGGELRFYTSGFSIFVVTAPNEYPAQGAVPINENEEYTMYIGDEPVTFYWAIDDANINSNYDGTWQVDNTDGAINFDVHYLDFTDENYTAPWITVTAQHVGSAKLTYVYHNDNGNDITGGTFTINVLNPDDDLYVANMIPENGCLVPAWKSGVAPDGVTYEWTRSDGLGIRFEALSGEQVRQNGVNVSLDYGGVVNDRLEDDDESNDHITYTVTAYYTDGSVAGTASYTVLYGNELLNTSFEFPDLDNKDVQSGAFVDPNGASDENTKLYFYNGYPGLYWQTTAPGEGDRLTADIEIIRANGKNTQTYFGIDTSADGDQFAEVNAENFGALYQDVLTTAGSEFTWSFSHAGRNNSNNTLYIVVAGTKYAQEIVNIDDIKTFLNTAVGDYENTSDVWWQTNYQRVNENYPLAGIPNTDLSFKEYVDDRGNIYYIWKHEGEVNNWEEISGTCIIPDEQYLTRLMFISEVPWQNYNNRVEPGYNVDDVNATMGNFIDGVNAGASMKYSIEYYVDDGNGEILYDGNNNTTNYTESGIGRIHNYVEARNIQELIDDGYYLTAVTVNGMQYGDIATVEESHLLYITRYGMETTAQFQLHCKKQAIKVTKIVEFEGSVPANFNQNNYKVSFNLSTNDEVVSVHEFQTSLLQEGDRGDRYYISGDFYMTPDGEMTFLPSLSTTEKPIYYVVEEDTVPKYDGYVVETKYEITYTYTNEDNVIVTTDPEPYDPTKDTIEITLEHPIATITCTNTYTLANADLTITKTAANGTTFYPGESFIFDVKDEDGNTVVTVVINPDDDPNTTDSVTIKGLEAGKPYTVTERENWSYRYTASCDKNNGEITLSSTGENEIIFTNTDHEDNTKYLYSEAYCKNIFVDKITPTKDHEDEEVEVDESPETAGGND